MLIEDIPYFAYHFRADIAAAKPARVLPGVFSDDEIAARFRMTVRAIRERALARGIRRRPLLLTEIEVLQLMEPVACSKSIKGTRSGTSVEHSVDELSTRLQKQKTKQMLDESRKPSKPGLLAIVTNVLPLASRKPPRSI
jgi:hypothetical protein